MQVPLAFITGQPPPYPLNLKLGRTTTTPTNMVNTHPNNNTIRAQALIITTSVISAHPRWLLIQRRGIGLISKRRHHQFNSGGLPRRHTPLYRRWECGARRRLLLVAVGECSLHFRFHTIPSSIFHLIAQQLKLLPTTSTTIVLLASVPFLVLSSSLSLCSSLFHHRLSVSLFIILCPLASFGQHRNRTTHARTHPSISTYSFCNTFFFYIYIFQTRHATFSTTTTVPHYHTTTHTQPNCKKNFLTSPAILTPTHNM